MNGTPRREFLISKGWIQAVVLVVLSASSSSACSPTGRTWRTRRSRRASSTQSGGVLFTGNDVSQGQQVFLHNGLMEYGSVFGHGAYLGPDYTADYLRRVGATSSATRTAARPRTPRRARRSRTCGRTATTRRPAR